MGQMRPLGIFRSSSSSPPGSGIENPTYPNDIAGLDLWLDASDLLASELQTRWPDKSGNGNHGITYFAPPPTLDVNVLNGRPVVTFMKSAGAIRIESCGLFQEYSVFAVERRFNSAGGVAGRIISSGSTNHWFGHHVNPPPTGSMDIFSDGTYNPVVSKPCDDNWLMYSIVSDMQGTQVYRDGAFITSSVTNGSGFGGQFFISGYSLTAMSETTHCQVAEVFAYSRKIDDNDRVNMEQYLRNKWGLQTGTTK